MSWHSFMSFIIYVEVFLLLGYVWKALKKVSFKKSHIRIDSTHRLQMKTFSKANGSLSESLNQFLELSKHILSQNISL